MNLKLKWFQGELPSRSKVDLNLTLFGYLDKNPIFYVCLKAQQFYHEKNLPTKVKACVTIGLDELLMLAGVDALTIMPDDLRELSKAERDETELTRISLFGERSNSQQTADFPSYVDSERKYRVDFASSDKGQAQFKPAQVNLKGLRILINIFCWFHTMQAISFFCEVQNKAEMFVMTQLGEIF